MKKTKRQEMIDNLSSSIQAFGGDSYCITDSTQGEDMKEAYDYYYGKLPAAYTKGGSSYVDRTVWESVNGALQDLLNVFTSNEQAVRFAPTNSYDADGALAATAYVNKVLLRDNSGYKVLHDTFKEALISRLAFVKRYWQHNVEQDVRTIEHVSEEELSILLSEYDDNEDVNDSMLDIKDNEDGTKTATISIPVNKSQVVVEFVSAEQIDFDIHASSIADCNYFRHMAVKKKNELIDLGFDDEAIESAKFTDIGLMSEAIEDARSRNLIGDLSADYEQYVVEEIYVRASKPGERKNRLYQVWRVNNKILDFNEVSEIPFEVATPFPVPGNIVGESIFDITKDIQNVKTALIRGYIDSTMNANYGRFTAVEGNYDKRSLLENRPGGVVEISAPGMVDLFPYHPLPQGMDSILEQIEQAKERRTGVTRLGMGLSPEVFKGDNAYATVDMMMSAAQNRMRMLARNMAQNFMTSLFLGIYKLIQDNETRELPIEINGEMRQVIPSRWADRDRVIVSVAIGNSEKRERASNLVQLMNILTSNPMIAGKTFTETNANHIAREITLAMGFYDINNFVTPIERVEPQPPNPLEELELQIKQAEIQKMQVESESRQQEVQVQMERAKAEQMEAQAKLQKAELEESIAGDKMNIEQAESESRQSKMASDSFVSEEGLRLREKELHLKAIELELRQRELDINEKRIMLEYELEKSQQRPISLSMGTKKPATMTPAI